MRTRVLATTSNLSRPLRLLAAAAILLTPSSGSAAIAGTGVQSGSVPRGGGPFTLIATFDDVTYDVLGESVNLGAQAGSFQSSATWTFGSPLFTNDSVDPALGFTSTGTGRCTNRCGSQHPSGFFESIAINGLSGNAVDNGPGTLPAGSGIQYSLIAAITTTPRAINPRRTRPV